eukprot:SAG11_NODE_100_length_16863_cov_12.374911_14_plen_111_part_00
MTAHLASHSPGTPVAHTSVPRSQHASSTSAVIATRELCSTAYSLNHEHTAVIPFVLCRAKATRAIAMTNQIARRVDRWHRVTKISIACKKATLDSHAAVPVPRRSVATIA